MTSRTPQTEPETHSSADAAIERFAVRRTDQGFGVWDAAVNGWHSRRDLDESTATALADGMNARAATTRITPRVPPEAAPSGPATSPAPQAPPSPPGPPGPQASPTRPADGPPVVGPPPTAQAARAFRKVEPPRRVLVLIDGAWWPGSLDWWVRETDGWYGRAVLDVGGPSNWYAASSLRPAPRDPSP